MASCQPARDAAAAILWLQQQQRAMARAAESMERIRLQHQQAQEQQQHQQQTGEQQQQQQQQGQVLMGEIEADVPAHVVQGGSWPGAGEQAAGYAEGLPAAAAASVAGPVAASRMSDEAGAALHADLPRDQVAAAAQQPITAAAADGGGGVVASPCDSLPCQVLGVEHHARPPRDYYSRIAFLDVAAFIYVALFYQVVMSSARTLADITDEKQLPWDYLATLITLFLFMVRWSVLVTPELI